MAVFWFGWAKKLKNIFTKQQADTYYLQKNSSQLQQVNGLVDFHNNIVCKQNGYVDYVDTNGPTSMINKRYLEEQTLSKTSTSAQTVAGPVNLRSSIEFGTEIKAGYGGGSVKFIPEDNSTKTLQFYNNNANDTRRFKLLVPNPTEAQNPATKQYVDNAINSIQVGRSIKSGNTIFQTESKNITADTPTSYLPASGFSISNLEVGKLYLVEVRWSTGSYARAPIFYQGSNGSQMYLAWIDTAILFGRSSNNLLVRANKAVNNISISFKEVIITS